jgi:hypothetical protein
MVKNKQRGILNIYLGGHNRTLRFRSHEICMLEERLGMGISKILSEDLIGIRVLREAILVGVMHEFAGKKGKEAKLTTVKVSRWIDDHGDFAELLTAVVETIAMGLPGAEELMAEEETDDEEEGDGESSPFVGSQTTSVSSLAS